MNFDPRLLPAKIQGYVGVTFHPYWYRDFTRLVNYAFAEARALAYRGNT